ncbi:MAG: SRPBCC domain-containing protein [Chitinophagales bacterium]
MIVKNTISINAPATKVWDALVNPEKTKVYMFGCETVSEWKIGDALDWKGNYEGNDMIFVKGFVLEIKPNQLLKYSVFDPNATYPDIPQNYLNVTYTLSEENGQTILTVTQDGFENAAEGEKRFAEASNNGDGWDPILIEIKKLVESEESK